MNELPTQTAMNLLVVTLAITSLCPSALALVFWVVSAMEKTRAWKWMQPVASKIGEDGRRWPNE
jgi:hypothetical protein